MIDEPVLTVRFALSVTAAVRGLLDRAPHFINGHGVGNLRVHPESLAYINRSSETVFMPALRFHWAVAKRRPRVHETAIHLKRS